MIFSNRYKALVVGLFLLFMLLHQADRLLIGQVLADVQRDFRINDAQAGAIGTGALVVAAIFYLVWGYLYDRFARAKLLALASFLWGITTALSAVVTTFPAFLVTRSSTGIDDASYPGIYSLASDYFPPRTRGKVYGLLQITGPLGFVVSLVLVLALKDAIGWRSLFLLTGGLGIVVGVLILLFVRDVPRGSAEPELQNVAPEELPTFEFNWAVFRAMLQRRTLLPLYLQGFFGIFPFNVITFWFFTYLERERGYGQEIVFPIMLAAVVMMAIGAVVGGAIGDALFRRTPRGRLTMSLTGVTLAMVLLFVSLNLPQDTPTVLFGAMLALTAFFTLFSGPNVVGTVHDITVPEARSSALSVQYFIENIGAASAPFLVGALSESMGISRAIILVCTGTYVLCALFLVVALRSVPGDIAAMQAQMQQRSQEREAVAG
ncbi:MAG: MFS transporter [bacterium]|nr:MFS transporter [bacterium]